MVFSFLENIVSSLSGGQQSGAAEDKTPKHTSFTTRKGPFGLTNPFETKKERPCPNYNPCTIKSRMTEFLANLNRIHPTHVRIEKPCPPQVGKVQCQPSSHWPPKHRD